MSPTRALRETDRTRHRRLREQGSLDRDQLDAVLAAGFVCHLGVTLDGAVMVVPTIYGSDGETLYFHGSAASRSLVASPPVAGPRDRPQHPRPRLAPRP